MAKRTIDIRLGTTFDNKGVQAASKAIDDFNDKLKSSNKWLLQINAELSTKIHNTARNMAEDLAAAADKRVVSQHLLSAKEIEEAWRKAMTKPPEEAAANFGKMRGIAQDAAKGIGGAFSKIGGMFLRGGIWGAVVAAVVKVFSWGWNKIKEDAEKAAKRIQRSFDDSVETIKKGAAEIEQAFDLSISSIDKTISRFDSMTNSIKELTKAEIELAKQRAIANGADPEVAKAAAEDLAAEVDFNAEEDRLRKVIEMERERIKVAKEAEAKTAEEVKKATAVKTTAEEDYQKKREKFAQDAVAKANAMMSIATQGARGLTEDEAARERAAALSDFDDTEEGKTARDNVRKAEELLKGIKTDEKAIAAADEARSKIEKAQIALDALATRREARELSVQNEIAEKVKEDQKEAENAAKKAAEEEKKEAKQAAAERERLDRELHQKRMEDIRKESDATKKALADTQKDATRKSAIIAAAQSEFDRAFAAYRDPEKAAAQIGEERAYAADLKRLHKDASRYAGKWRIDELSRLMAAGDTQGMADTLEGWRKSSRFSPQVEAMVRASAAEQTKTTVEDELRKIETNTADLSAKLEELISMKGA